VAVIAVFLASAVACVWLGSPGLTRFGSAYDRLHCVTFVAVTAGFFVVVAAFVADGVSGGALKILVFFILTLAAPLRPALPNHLFYGPIPQWRIQ
jgi:multisubunit Na+/H+ antiporter MnhG subunit